MTLQRTQEKFHRKNPQNFVTICSVIGGPYHEREALEDLVQRAIDRLGNPARPDIWDRLRKIHSLHFISLHVIRGKGKAEPSYLLLEMSVDGEKEPAISDLCLHMGESLFPIYHLAKVVKKKKQLESQLLRDSVEIMQSIWPEFYHGNRRNGLEFSGTAGLEVKDIHDDETIANYARDIIDREVHVSGDADEPTLKDKCPYLTPYKIFSHVQDKFDTGDMPDDVAAAWDHVCRSCDTPNFAETSDAIWKKVWDIPTILKKAVPVAFFAHLAWIFLGIASLVWIALNTKTSMKLIKQGVGDKAVEIPPATHISGLSETLSQFYFSPRFVITGLLLALVTAMVLDTCVRLLNHYFHKKGVRPGGVFWFTGAFLIYFGFYPALMGFRAYLESLYHNVLAAPNLWESTKILTGEIAAGIWQGIHYVGDGLNILPKPTEHSALALAIVLLTVMLVVRKTRDTVTFILSVTIFCVLLYAVHCHFMVLQNPDYLVQNRWSDAGLPELVFYPLTLAVMLTAAFYSAVTHAPPTLHRWAHIPLDTLAAILERFGKSTQIVARMVIFFRSQKIYIIAFIGFFLWVFSQAFFPKGPDQGLIAYLRPFIEQAILIPAIVAGGVYGLYLITDKTLLKSARTDNKRHVKPLALLFVLAFMVINYGSIAASVLIVSALALALPLTVIALLMLAGILWLWLRSSERANEPEDFNPDVEAIQKMISRENTNLAQNHMISVQRLLPQNFRRRFALPMGFLVLLKILKGQRFRPGFLSHMGTVQYARWIHLPNTNNYIFLSNYDGSWESYLEDFITKASAGLGIAWSHCKGFPRARGIVLDGASDGDRFKRWARRSMQPTPFWYSAYPELSSEEIRRNALIRDGLVKKDLSPSDAGAWLDLFHSMPRPEDHLQTDKIQNILFGGNGKLKAGGCLAISRADMSKPDADLGPWIKAITADISFGIDRPGTQASYIALSAEGLKMLGLEQTLTGDDDDAQDDPTRFSTAFAMGMNHEARKHILRDIGKNAPDKWQWGGPDNPVLAVLLVYGLDGDHYEAQIKKLTATGAAQLSRYNLKIAYTTTFEELGDGIATEPFGFADGISQPIIEGTKDGLSAAESIHLVKPGEFILGYKDNRGYFPPSPEVEARDDTTNVLPAIPSDLPQRYPKFAGEDALKTMKRDLGRNGSYLVIRHLEQDKPTFDRNIDEAADYLLKLRLITPYVAKKLDLPAEFTGKTIRELSLEQLQKVLEISKAKTATKQASDLKRQLQRAPEPVQTDIEKINEKIRGLRLEEITKERQQADPSGNWKLDDVTKEYDEREKRWKDAIPELMIGRKKNGQSLVSCPHRIIKQSGKPIDVELGVPKDATFGVPEELHNDAKQRFLKADNEFLLGRDDPQGHACPYGSHVRRSNPRDGLNLENEEALTITNRHRILRRGRAYKDADTDAEGTFFICLNADIERQFEFIQQTWVASPKFHGLSDEVDPITAQGIDHNLNDQPHNQRFTIQAPLGDLKISGLSSYVTLRGGGYFFLPGLDTLRFLGERG